jgi:hypothetical protein
MGIKDYLPDLKGALVGFYEEKLKDALETKSSEYKAFFNQKSQEYKTLIQQNALYGQQTQKALIAIALGIFLLLAIAYF